MVSYIRPGRIYLAMGSYCLYRASRPLRKGRSGVLTSTDFETMASHDVGAVYFTEYLSVLFQLTYLDKLYGECNGTARACVNSGYQALFSPITKSAWERGYARVGPTLQAPLITRKRNSNPPTVNLSDTPMLIYKKI